MFRLLHSFVDVTTGKIGTMEFIGKQIFNFKKGQGLPSVECLPCVRQHERGGTQVCPRWDSLNEFSQKWLSHQISFRQLIRKNVCNLLLHTS